MKLPRAVQRLVEAWERLPGIGPKTAQRLTFYLLHVPQTELDQLGQAVVNLKRGTKICSVCFNVGETDPCAICADVSRDKSAICVVEQPLDVVAVERSDGYKGLYHVLHGVISPLDNIGPDDLYLRDLLPRLTNGVREIVLATNPTMEGEATAMYIAQLLRERKMKNAKLKITRLGRGLPVGGDIEYADEVTLSKAFEGRKEF
ncbi:MAG: recombination protein RecR [Candidatus Chisholmbacteria bacterium RIFCSPHIGHO2_01_FULL_48_12]|uniref:Recombination protein RecR n=1 Tax=Candidatus Chisholmbacteria bacterium RIFCSPHIGHO2_01_FULL_48_12 TaxID=1797589 RepID=A0A1G1VQM4_9BACT|nr:MAG: recombination protein RecR [Candidatus Chisholmbacteria bacterium RIFCSPHIGHO2_01_FULL_48_12]